MPAAKGLGGSRDVGDAVHGGGRGARGRGHEDGQVWHLGQVDDACREKREDCQDNVELLQAWPYQSQQCQPDPAAFSPAAPKPLGSAVLEDLLHS